MGLSYTEYARALHWRPNKRVLMLKVYFDDSGRDEQIVGGCLADEQVWAIVDHRWGLVLRDYKLQWFHAVDFEDGQHKDYAHLTRPEKDALFNELLDALSESIGLPKRAGGFWGAYICGVVPADSVETLRGIAGNDRRSRKREPQPRNRRERWTEDVVALHHDPYCVALGLCFRTVLDECGVSQENPVHVLVADQPNRKSRIDFVYSMAVTIERWSRLLSGISNGPEMRPRDIRPLQAADFVAYYLGKSVRSPKDLKAAAAATTMKPVFIRAARGLGVTDGWHR